MTVAYSLLRGLPRRLQLPQSFLLLVVFLQLLLVLLNEHLLECRWTQAEIRATAHTHTHGQTRIPILNTCTYKQNNGKTSWKRMKSHANYIYIAKVNSNSTFTILSTLFSLNSFVVTIIYIYIYTHTHTDGDTQYNTIFRAAVSSTINQHTLDTVTTTP